MKKIFVFGNKDLKEDNLPLKILSQLQKKFPDIEFAIKDPNEEWDTIDENDAVFCTENLKDLIVLDTVMGIKRVKVFDDLKIFTRAPRVGMHDFDALTNLLFLQKLGRINVVKVVGVPPNLSESEALKQIGEILHHIKKAKGHL
ncbi:MAG: hypothetical protein JW740_01740 [Candidatus Zambryskibacteria bacterium]|nr:hypothetical protein [Candidatus Zambryskibacteria bacterium]